MPNWVSNNIIIQSDNAEALANLKKKVGATVQVPSFDYVKDEDGKIVLGDDGMAILTPTHHTIENPVLSFWNILQPGAEDFETYSNQGWYDWNIEHWGTKWDVAGNVEVIEDTDSYWHLVCDTAWSAPHEALVALSSQFPEVSIRNEWTEEQGYGAHQEYSEGTHWVDKEWDTPETHEQYEENVGECYCMHESDEEHYPFADCPRELSETQVAVAELEKVSELV